MRTPPRHLFVTSLLLPCILVACGGSGGGSSGDGGGGGGGAGTATVNGTLGGRTFTPADAIALKGVYDSSYPGIVIIYMSSVPNMCALYQQLANTGSSSPAKANLFDLGFTLGATDATSVVVPGTYGTGGPAANELDNAGWDSYDASCNVTHSPGTSSASVTLTSAGPTYVGTFDVTFIGGDHATGSFDAPLCDLTLPDAGAADAGAVCLP